MQESLKLVNQVHILLIVINEDNSEYTQESRS